MEIKQSLLSYLEQANKFIRDNVENQQQSVVQPQIQPVTTQSLPADFWDEFDNPSGSQNVVSEGRYNDDGTYTIEYITHLATTPLGFNKDIYDQLMQENEIKRQQSDEPMTDGEGICK